MRIHETHKYTFSHIHTYTHTAFRLTYVVRNLDDFTLLRTNTPIMARTHARTHTPQCVVHNFVSIEMSSAVDIYA